MKSTEPIYEDKKTGSSFSSCVRFRCSYIVNSLQPKSTSQEAEREAACEVGLCEFYYRVVVT